MPYLIYPYPEEVVNIRITAEVTSTKPNALIRKNVTVVNAISSSGSSKWFIKHRGI
jgi:hypothetical protein